MSDHACATALNILRGHSRSCDYTTKIRVHAKPSFPKKWLRPIFVQKLDDLRLKKRSYNLVTFFQPGISAIIVKTPSVYSVHTCATVQNMPVLY